ncbi:MAG: tetratricopeptide repeat protein [Nitrospirota bacterium]
MFRRLLVLFLVVLSVFVCGCAATSGVSKQEPKPAKDAARKEADQNFIHGLYAMQHENYNLAEQYFLKVLAYDNKSFNTHMMLGQAYEALGRSVKAIDQYNAAIALRKQDARPYVALMGVYYDMHMNDAIIRTGEDALASGVKPKIISGDLGWAYFIKGDVDKAEDKLKYEVKESPDNTMALIKLGIVYFAQQKYEDALPNLKKAESLDKSSALANYISAVTYKSLGKRDEAFAEVKEGLTRDKALDKKVEYYNKEFFPREYPEDISGLFKKAKDELKIAEPPANAGKTSTGAATETKTTPAAPATETGGGK